MTDSTETGLRDDEADESTMRSVDPDGERQYPGPDVADDEPDEASDDPMASSIKSDEEKRKREDPNGDDDPSSSETAPDAPDPTDAPDLTASVLTRVSWLELAPSVTLLLVATSVAALALLSPDRVSPILGRGIGGALVLGTGWLVVAEARQHRFGVRLASLAAGVAIVGVLLAIDPDRWLTPIGQVLGVVFVIFGLNVLRHDRADGDSQPASVVGGVALVLAGVASWFWFEAGFETIVVVAALVAMASGVVRVAVRSGFTTVAPRSRRRRPLLLRWIDAKSREPESREAVNAAVFFEGDRAPADVARFLLMMLLASVISAAGVLADSTAVVIGAMLIAPLITPMMGMGLALVTGWPNRLSRSALLVLLGSLVAIGTGALLAAVTGFATDLETNTQIVSRSSPRLIDLVIALAAGAAGAYALCRKEASSSLPGVAVAIALVPPLSVVGVTADGGDWRQASGTLVLFLTNLVAIIFAGGFVFLLTGVVPLKRFAENQHRVRTSIGAVAVLAVVAVGALVINGRQIADDAFGRDQARDEVDEWLGGDSDFQIVSVDVRDGDVEVVITGPGEPPPARTLAAGLADRLGGGLELDLQWIPRQRVVIATD